MPVPLSLFPFASSWLVTVAVSLLLSCSWVGDGPAIVFSRSQWNLFYKMVSVCFTVEELGWKKGKSLIKIVWQ